MKKSLAELLNELKNGETVVVEQYKDIIYLEIFMEENKFFKNEYKYRNSKDPYDQSEINDNLVLTYLSWLVNVGV